MIDINPPLKVRTRYVNNITDAYRAADAHARRNGRAWYHVAHDLAGLVGDGDFRRGAGILAVLSANKRWSDNVRLAKDAAAGNVHGHTRDNLAKVERIMAGENPDSVLPVGRKTHDFFRCIFDPYATWPVVIDRHAHDVAVGETYGERDRGLSSPTRYGVLADAYRAAGARLKVQAMVVQATVWVAHREIISGTGHRGQLTGGAL